MQSMPVFILKRLLYGVLVLLMLSFVIFSFIRIIPGDPVRMSLGPTVSEEVVQKIRHERGGHPSR